MNETIHVVMAIKQYEEILNYLSTTQIYGNVAKLIAETVNDVNANLQSLEVLPISRPMSATPVANQSPELKVVKNADIIE
jgi:hypothetical protein